jgi:hypothetical protein
MPRMRARSTHVPALLRRLRMHPGMAAARRVPPSAPPPSTVAIGLKFGELVVAGPTRVATRECPGATELMFA